MPKTRFDNPNRDAPLELVLGRKSSLGLSEERLAEKMHFSRNTLRARLDAGSDCPYLVVSDFACQPRFFQSSLNSRIKTFVSTGI